MAVAVAVGVGVAALATAAAAATSATAAASAVHQDAGEDVPPACAGGTTPGAKVCVTVDVHVEAVAGAGGAGLTRFVVEDALETAILPAIAAETGLEPSRDIKLVVDTPPEGQAGGDNDDGGDDEAVTGTSAGDGNDDGEGGSSGLSAGAVAGIVVGVMALAVLVVAVVVTLWRRRTHL